MSGKVSTEIRREVSQTFAPVRESVEQAMSRIRTDSLATIAQIRGEAAKAKESFDKQLAEAKEGFSGQLLQVTSSAEAAKTAAQEAVEENAACEAILASNRRTMIRVAILSAGVALVASGILSFAIFHLMP